MNDPVSAASYDVYAAKRDQKGMIDAWVAKKAGIAPETIYAWKAGKYMPKYQKLSAIADVLGCGVLDLLTQKEGGRDAQSDSGSVG